MSEHQQTQQSKKPDSTFQKQAALTSLNSVSHPASIIQRARIDPKSLTPADVLQLQRTIGNRAVGRLLSEIRNPSKVQQATVQRQTVPEEEKEPLQGMFGKKPEEEICPSCTQRQEETEEKETLQGKFETIQRLEPEEEEKLQMKSVVQRPEIHEEEEPLQGKMADPVQRQEIPEEEEPIQGKMIGTVQRQEFPEEEEPLQKKSENNTGMPDNLKAGVENLSGIDMSDVRVHYNSDKPAEVGALAYTQGTNIHVAPGQEKHLPHEAWHVVQQVQGKVKPTMQLKGMTVNDDEGLEHEADEMGEKAEKKQPQVSTVILSREMKRSSLIQARLPMMDPKFFRENPKMAREILIHTVKNNKETFREETKNWREYFETLRDDQLENGYKELIQYIPKENMFLSEKLLPPAPSVSSEDIDKINRIINEKVIPYLIKLRDDPDLLKSIFCDREKPETFKYLDTVKLVICKILDELQQIIRLKTSPVTIMPNPKHTRWARVGGAAIIGSKRVDLPQDQYSKLLESSWDALAALVHEFSHAAGGTIDIGYSIKELETMPTKKRVKNAETYAAAFLLVADKGDQRILYDPQKIIRTKPRGPGEKEQVTENSKVREAGINEILVKLWNDMDNAYSLGRVCLNGIRLIPSDVADQLTEIIYNIIYPHKPNLHEYIDYAMALIEDRARGLFVLQKNIIENLEKSGIKRERIDSDLNAQNREQEYNDLATELIKTRFCIGRGAAKIIVQNTLNFSAEIKKLEPKLNYAEYLRKKLNEESEIINKLNAESRVDHISRTQHLLELQNLISEYEKTFTDKNWIQQYKVLLPKST